MTGKLRIGRIHYANLFPIFYMLKEAEGRSSYEFIDGVPSTLNRMLREGEVDISPSSSIEYLRYPELYTLIEGHSISSFGPVRSVLLFSRKPIEALGSSTVLVSSQSETSGALLAVILKKIYGLDCSFQLSSEKPGKALAVYPAYLLIGDEAMRAAARLPAQGILRYDLGELWYRHTGLPFVFALWIARKDCCREDRLLFDRFQRDLALSKTKALQELSQIAHNSPLREFLTEEAIVEYWKGISYDLTEEHRRGLSLFREHAGELGLL